MDIRNIFSRKPEKILQLLLNQSSLTMKGLDWLKTYMGKHGTTVALEISNVEREADEVRRILIEELMRTSITPFDREDIFSLSREIDDVIDYANTTVDEMEILGVSPTPFMARMASLLYDASVEINFAILRLQDRHLSVASNHCQRAKTLENSVEALYREAIAALFQEPKSMKQVVNILKVREIYRHLSNAADREDMAANVISNIIMKMS